MRVNSIDPEVFEATLHIKAVGTPEVTRKNDQELGKEVCLTKDIVKERLESAVLKASIDFPLTNKRLEFNIHDKTNGIIVKIIDTKTDEVIREIPPEKYLDLVARIWELTGILVDERV